MDKIKSNSFQNKIDWQIKEVVSKSDKQSLREVYDEAIFYFFKIMRSLRFARDDKRSFETPSLTKKLLHLKLDAPVHRLCRRLFIISHRITLTKTLPQLIYLRQYLSKSNILSQLRTSFEQDFYYNFLNPHYLCTLYFSFHIRIH